MPIDASILNEVEHLRELNQEEKAALAEKIDLLRYSTGQSVFNYGDPGHAMYIVRSGEVEIYRQERPGREDRARNLAARRHLRRDCAAGRRPAHGLGRQP